jgi:hypothetical protein
MNYTTRRFWEYYNALPEEVQQTADRCYELFKIDSSHPSLHFKKVGKYWSVRLGQNYRALGVEVQDGISWFWIGMHSEYDKIINM